METLSCCVCSVCRSWSCIPGTTAPASSCAQWRPTPGTSGSVIIALSRWNLSHYQVRLLSLFPDGIYLIIRFGYYRSFQMESISFLKQGLRGRSQTYPYLLSAKQEASVTIFITSLVWGWRLNPGPPAHRVNALPLSHHCSKLVWFLLSY